MNENKKNRKQDPNYDKLFILLTAAVNLAAAIVSLLQKLAG